MRRQRLGRRGEKASGSSAGRRSGKPRRPRASRGGLMGFEPLESRFLLSASPLITEFLASNKNGLVDAFGANSDWLEICNPDSREAVDLTNWKLQGGNTVWTFPSMSLGPGEYRVIFASGRNLTDASGELHTNFNLNKAGDDLALIDPTGITVQSWDPFPAQQANISYGVGQNVEETKLVPAGAATEATVRYFVPTNGNLGSTRTQTGFSDALWSQGTAGIGFANQVPGFAATVYKSNQGSVNNAAQAQSVVATPAYQSWTQSETAPVINYLNTGGSGEFANDRTFPGMTIGGDQDCYVLKATARVHIPSVGNYTFGVNSDDGFTLKVAGGTFVSGSGYTSGSGDTFAFDSLRGPADTVGTFSFTAAGDYDLTLLFWENGGGSGVELWAAPGTKATYDATFRLVGDTAKGGLAVFSLPPTGSGNSSAFASAIHTDVRTAVQNAVAQLGNNPTSLYTRIAFDAANRTTLTSLTLKMKYDDGYVAYLNGVKVASRNAPANPAWNSLASGERSSDSLATAFENLDLTPYLYLLQDTGNVLAIQGLMSSAADTDLLVLPELSQIVITSAGDHFFSVPSPGAPNTVDTWQTDLSFSVDHGFFYAPVALELTTSTPSATIFYTTDNSTPSATHGTQYTGTPINVTTTTTVRAVSVLGGHGGVSETRTYIFPNDVVTQPAAPAGFPATWGAVSADYAMDTRVTNDPVYKNSLVQDLLAIPTMSIVTDNVNLFDPATGLYTNPTIQGVQKPASIEYFDPATNEGFQINAGLSMQGGVGRDPQFKKHSFRLIFSSNYGPTKLDFPLFDGAINLFDNITLRANFNDAWVWGGTTSQFVRDQFADRTFLAMGGPGEHGGFVQLYVNGLYWGLYNPVERPDTSFAAKYLGGNKADWDVIHCGGSFETVDQSNVQPWNDLMTFFAANDVTAATGYQKLLGNSPDGTPNPAYPVQLDVNEYVDYLLMNFFGGNTDWPYHNYSMGRQRDPGSTGFKAFPWDSEWTMGMGGDQNTNVTGIGNANTQGGASSDISTPYYYLKSNAEFRLLFADHAYKALANNGALTTAATLARYQELADTVQAAIVTESARWGDVSGTLCTQANWISERDWILNTFLPQRTGVLLGQLRAAGLYPSVDPPSMALNGAAAYGGTFNPGDTLTLSAPAGTIYYTLDGSDPRLAGGGVNPAALVWSGNAITLNQGAALKARILSNGTWSALADASFYVNLAPSIRISELMYTPAAPSAAEIAAGYTDNNLFEFVEITNIGNKTLPLQGLRFTNGINYTFGNVSIAPGQYVIVAADPIALELRYPGVSPSIVVGPYTGHLAGGGETIKLDAPNGGTIHEFSYKDTWYGPTNDEGFSLTVRDPNQDLALWDKSDGWRASAAPGGSPGTSDTLSLPGSVIVSEVLSHTSIAPGDMIEFFNTTNQPINIGGWVVSDSNDNLMKYRIAAGTVLAAHGYFVLTADGNFGPIATDPGRLAPFALSEHGDDVYLSSTVSTTVVGGYREHVDFGGAPNGVATGLYTKSTGGDDFTLLQRPTFGTPAGGVYPGGPNAIPYVSPLVFNELMYHPPAPSAAEQAAGFSDPEQFEFVELYNRSGAALPLGNFYLGDGLGFTFGWYGDGTGSEVWTLESGATATWTANNLAPGSYSVWAHYTLVDGDGKRRSLDDAAQYTVNGSAPVTVDQNQPAATGDDVWVDLGTYNFGATGTIQLTRGLTGPGNWTIADAVRLSKPGSPDVTIAAPTLSSFSTSHAMTSVAPGGYMVLVSDYAAFDARYHVAANNIPVAGVYTGRLNNGGEMLRLYQSGNPDPGVIPYYQIDHVNYGTHAPWVSEPAERGASLIRLHTAEYGNDAINWEAGATGGTPGAANVAIDRTAPSVPTGLAGAILLNPARNVLTWNASSDAQTYVDHYVVYRNGASIGTATGAAFTTTDVQPKTTYVYEVSAVNRDGYESARSAGVSLALPTVLSIAGTDSRHIEITFSEPLNPASGGVLGNYASSGGSLTAVALSRGNTKVTLTTAQNMTAGVNYTVTMNNLTTASGRPLPASQQATFKYASMETGYMLREYWTNIGGTAVIDLTNNPAYPSSPTGTSYPTSFEAPSNWAEGYGTRMRGYLTPPTSGQYTFWIASDDNSELWLSTDENPANKVKIAYVAAWTSSREWGKEANQQSAAITLQAGKHYYIEALQKEGGGGDNLAVRWQLPGGAWENNDSTLPIPGSRLSPFGALLDMTPPSAPTGLQATITGATPQVNLSWSPAADADSGVDHYVIYRDGTQLATATATTYADTAGITSTSRHSYQVSAVNYDGFEGPRSLIAALAPAGLAAIMPVNNTSLRVWFTETVDAASAQTLARYSISDGITVSAAQLDSDKLSVLLTTSNLGTTSHNLTVSGVTTLAGATLPTQSGTFVNTPPGWSVTLYQATAAVGGIGNLATAQSVVDNASYQAWVRTATAQTLNYATDGGSGGHVAPDNALPGQGSPNDGLYNYVMKATGSIYIPTAGTWSFDVNSDDGFRLTIGANSFQFDAGRGQSDSFATFDFPAAGYYSTSLLFFQGSGPSGLEVWAEPGNCQNAWNGSFRLIGDAASGGLSMQGGYASRPYTVAVDRLGTGDPSPGLSGTVNNANVAITVRVHGVYYAAINNGNGTWTLPRGLISPLATGTYDVLALASDASGQCAMDTTLGDLTIDASSPTVGLTPVAPDPRGTAVGSIAIQFNEAVTGFGVGDFQLTLDGLSAPLTGATLSTSDSIHWTLGNLAGLTSRSGSYGLTLSGVSSGITDLSNNSLAAGLSESWVNNAPLPTATVEPIAPDPRTGPIASVTVDFSTPVTGLNPNNLRLTRDGSGNLLTGAEILRTSDFVHWTLEGLDAITAAPGAYVFTVLAGGANIVDAAGNPLAANASDAWVVSQAAAPTVQAVILNDGGAQRSAIASLAFRFDSDVSASLDSGDLTLINTDTGTPLSLAGITPAYDPATNTARWNLAGLTFQDGHYTATLAAAGVTNQEGLPLAGGDRAVPFFRLLGDTDGSASVDIFDVANVQVNYGQTSGMSAAEGDFDGNGTVDIFDVAMLQTQFGKSLTLAGAPPAAGAADLPAASPAAPAEPVAANSAGPTAAADEAGAGQATLFDMAIVQQSYGRLTEPAGMPTEKVPASVAPQEHALRPAAARLRPTGLVARRLAGEPIHGLGAAHLGRHAADATWEPAVDRVLEDDSLALPGRSLPRPESWRRRS
ncbi:MAG: lamin tail domain-containing protein [Pirellulales bacterium]